MKPGNEQLQCQQLMKLPNCTLYFSFFILIHLFFYFFCSYVLWMGDLNFRIDELQREDVLTRIEKKEYDYLLQYDQVSISPVVRYT